MIIGKDLKGSGRGLIQVLFRHLPRGTEKHQKNLIQASQCPDRALPEYKGVTAPPVLLLLFVGWD
jgi:hypothetical protein